MTGLTSLNFRRWFPDAHMNSDHLRSLAGLVACRLVSKPGSPHDPGVPLLTKWDGDAKQIEMDSVNCRPSDYVWGMFQR